MVTYYGLNAELDILHVQLYSIFLIMLWYECCFPHFINKARFRVKIIDLCDISECLKYLKTLLSWIFSLTNFQHCLI